MKKIYIFTAMAFWALTGLTGCTKKGDDFIGTWNRVDDKFDKTKEDSLIITRDDEVFHINRKHWGFMRKYETENVQARAESEKVLSSIGSNFFGTITFSIENGSLFTSQGAEYKRM
ncbi:hypothetical protein D9M71_610750 [compost metagenome]